MSPSRARRVRVFPGVVGFYFVSRVAYTLLFFQANPIAGSIVSIGIDLALLIGAWLYTTEDGAPEGAGFTSIPAMRWIFVYLFFILSSTLWSAALSVTSAVAYWVGLVMDMAIVFVLLRRKEPRRCTESLMMGAVWGAAFIAGIAWLMPLTSELRLGNDIFLHPNTLGLELGIATLLAQYLAPQGRRWKWLGIALAITLLRTISKTAISALVVAEAWYLILHLRISRKTGMRILLAVLVVVGCFWGAIRSYLEIYNGGDETSFETLTGRTVMWATAIAMGLEHPWFGHGIYSFPALIPAFGAFEARHAHNELVQHFFEYGFVGVALLIGVHWSFLREIRRAVPDGLRALALALLIFSLIRGLGDTVSFSFSYPLWLMAALLITLRRAEGKDLVAEEVHAT